MADIVALDQCEDDRQFSFINVDTAMRFWFYCPMYGNKYGAMLECRVTRLPVTPYADNTGEDEHTIPIVFDSEALLLLNNLRTRCGLSPAVIAELAEDDDGETVG